MHTVTDRHIRTLRLIPLFFLFVFLILKPLPTFAEVGVPEIHVTDQTTIVELEQQSHLSREKLFQVLKIQEPVAETATLAQLGLDPQTTSDLLKKEIGLTTTESSKDWKLIATKFALWILALIGAGYLLRRVTILKTKWHSIRMSANILAALIFGFILGSDPNPMGTVNDAFVLYGQTGAIFPPRLIALVVFLLLSVIAIRFICGWGCQLGGLQETLFRFRQQIGFGKKIGPGIKVPFTLALGIRFAVLIISAVAAVGWATNLIGPIDPFSVFAPAKWTPMILASILVVLFLSLFIYRPWCTLACPFGTVAWLFERFAWMRIHSNPEKCTNCKACTKVCPSGHAAPMLEGAKLRPDCFACGDCIAACTHDAMEFSSRANQIKQRQVNIDHSSTSS
ncbi:4Fe-4S binding protein [Heliophilum fasciatum]|uniref:4Fe-4S binding protein n=1 Tax=Heliophilum fasciatum TaxID=35700 RepID=A0A4V2SWU3_9FIRM|nr:4Fe-4S dicluster domain-containing protein [Heliophilum fasciatum]MCW2278495.1 polyferredoxin [Heliophilum fasciatum]TCP63626.1 4Fe-4S binding protein [Heliophilum fasciatum]